MNSVLPTEKVFELSSAEARWLEKEHPLNFANLQRMIKEGRARIVEVKG